METTFGVKIDPRGAESGAAAIKRAVEDVRRSARGLHGDFLETFSGKAVLAGGIVTGLGMVGKALLDTSRAAAQYIGEIKDLSQHSSLATREASAMAYAASLNGTSVRDLSSGLANLNKNMIETVSGTGDGARLFKALGVSVTDARGQLRGTNDVFLDVVDRLHGFQEDGAKSTVIAKLLGKGMQDMGRAGKDALVSQMQEAERLGRTLDDTAIAKTEAWEKSTARLKGTLSGLSTEIGLSMIPTLTTMSDLTQKIVEDLVAGGRAAADFMKSSKGEPPQIGVARPDGGGRNLRIMPAPTGLDKAVVDKDPRFDPSLAGRLGQDSTGSRAWQDEHVKDFQRHSMDQLQLLFTGAASMRKEVEDQVERLIEDLKQDNQRTIDLITKDFAGDTHGERQQAAGRRIVEQTQKTVLAEEREQLIKNQEAWIQYGEQVGGSQEFMLSHRLDLVRLNLAKELDLTQDTAGRLLIAWQNHDEDLAQHILATSDKTATQIETIQLRTLGNTKKLIRESSNDVFSGWAEGMRTYMNNKDGFGMSQDMARRTAQGMEQGFQRFFFDGMSEKFKGFKDVLSGVLDFTKQIVSQMAAQMMTVGIIKPGASALAGLFGGNSSAGGVTGTETPMFSAGERFGGIERFAKGGISSRPRTMALGGRLVEFGEGPQAEAFVPLPDGRSIPVTMRFAGAMPPANTGVGGAVSITMPVNIINQHEGAQVETRQSTGANGMPQLDVLVLKVVNQGIADGKLDKTLGGRFGSALQPGRR